MTTELIIIQSRSHKSVSFPEFHLILPDQAITDISLKTHGVPSLNDLAEWDTKHNQPNQHSISSPIYFQMIS